MPRQNEREEQEKMRELRAAIQKGIASGVTKREVFSRIRRKHGLPQKES